MDNTKLQIDPAKLTEEQRTKLETYQQTQEQLRTLQDIADMTQEMLNVLDSQKAGDETSDKQMGALLMDMRDSLTALNAKEAPESPDYAKPVVDAVKALEMTLGRAIKAIDVKPVIDAPQVNVSPPSVDLKGVEKAVSNLSQSFQEAIKLINIPEAPEPDFQPLLDAWAGISEQLVSLENATRMKPQPGSMRISNLGEIPRQGLIPVAFSRISFTNADANGNYQTGTILNGVDVVGALTLAYDVSNNLTDVQFNAA